MPAPLMNNLPHNDVLLTLRSTLRKIDADRNRSPSLLELRRIMTDRIQRLEAVQKITTTV